MSKLTNNQFMRYSSHVLLPDMGEVGQLKLLNSRVLIIGIGGLGHAVANQLAAAGVKHMTLIDDDCVELSNLPRQLLFCDDDIGKSKVLLAASKLTRAYSDVVITPLCQRFTRHDENLAGSFDIIFDCTDNFSSRLVINEATVKQRAVLISAAISGDSGQLFCLDFAHCDGDTTTNNSTLNRHAGCYQCLYPEDSYLNQSCAHAGVLTSAVAAIASMQSLLGLNWLKSDVKQQQALMGWLHLFNANNLQWRQVRMAQDPQCRKCGEAQDTGAQNNRKDET